MRMGVNYHLLFKIQIYLELKQQPYYVIVLNVLHKILSSTFHTQDYNIYKSKGPPSLITEYEVVREHVDLEL